MVMYSGKKLLAGRRGTGVWFAVLFAVLLALYLPSFFNPPHGDYWEAFHTFHRTSSLPAGSRFIAIANHDPWQDGTYRPFSYLVLFFEYQVFGDSFVWVHIVNFLLYCLSVALLFRLALKLGINRVWAGICCGLFAFLFTHSGILTLTFHQFIIIGFSSFLGGFLAYLKWLETSRKVFLAAAGLLFWVGMFSYEAFGLWALAIAILRPLRRRSGGKQAPLLPDALMLAAVYLGYLTTFLLARTAPVTTGALPDITAGIVGLSFTAVFFNLVYTGVILNILPFLARPAGFGSWVELGGITARVPAPSLTAIVAGGGAAVFLLAAGGGVLLWRRKKLTALLSLGFPLFLYFSHFFIIVPARLSHLDLHHVLAQFRYQYVPNALVVLAAAAGLSLAVRPRRRNRLLTAGFVLPVLILNLVASFQTARETDRRLRPLGDMIARIRSGIQSGKINPDSRLYIDPQIIDYLPPLSWNRGIGSFVEGTYEWFFPGDQTDSFAFSRPDADWIMDRPWVMYRIGDFESRGDPSKASPL